jgi:hypothetical protein
MTDLRNLRPTSRSRWRRASPALLVLALVAALLGVAAPPAQAALGWNSGSSIYTRIINCPSIAWGTPYDENGIGAFVSYYGDQTSTPMKPATGEGTYMSTYVRLIGSHCSDPLIFPQFLLPAGVSFDKTQPIECYWTPSGPSNNPQQKITNAQQCPQWANVAADGTYTSAWPAWNTGWPLRQDENGYNGAGWEFLVPIKATSQQSGSQLRTRLYLADGNGNDWIAPHVNFWTGPPTVTAPGAPTSVSAQALSSTTARVSFSPPTSNGGSAVTGYTARCESSSGGATATASGTTSPINLSGLTPGATYSCDARAANSAGTGSWSAKTGSFNTPQARTVPGAPTGVTTTVLSARSAKVGFDPPASNGGSAITSYGAQCTSPDGGTSRSVSGITSPITFSTLTPGKYYRCRVRAVNAVGSGDYSAYSSTVNLPAVAPDRPTGVAARAASRTSARVTFTRPAYNGGAPVISYRVQCASPDGGGTRTADRASSPITVLRLTAGKAYRCRAKAINAAGSSVYSAYSTRFRLPA